MSNNIILATEFIKPDYEEFIVKRIRDLTRKGYELVIDSYDNKYYYLNGQLHRDNAPAIIYKNGYQEWRIHHDCHRLNGPAREWKDGKKSYYINDIYYQEDEYFEKLNDLGSF